MKINSIVAVVIAAGLYGSASAAPFSVSADFVEVTDVQSGLIWRRCPEGAVVTSAGDCTGTAIAVTHEAALALAKTQATASGKAWRLPNVRELGSLLKLNAAPAIDMVAFPNAPAIGTWTSSPAATDSSRAWAVDFFSGFIANESRTAGNRVRLVRTAP
jgi:Protein of unknown function (DUF1566)